MNSLAWRLAAIVVLALASQLFAQRHRAPAPAGMVNLPYIASDSAGNSWMIYQGGWMQHRGNPGVYGQTALIQINGSPVQNHANTARVDEKTGEVIFDNMPTAVTGVTITRRVLIDQKEGYLRYIDIFRNSTAQEQSLQYMIQTNLNYAVPAAQYINEPGGKGRALGWAAATPPAPRGAAELYAGRRAKLVPTLNWQQNSNFLQASAQLLLPPNKDVALMHVHATCATPEAGAQQMLGLKESKLLAGVPAEVRRAIVNFATSGGYMGDREVLRGDVLDVVELRGAADAEGDQLKGTLKESTLKLTTFYGEVTLSADKVQGVINVGQFRPRQLVVTTDGEVFGGRLEKETIALELSSGQTTQIPLSQISRFGWRKRADEPDDADLAPPTKPILSLRSGDRIAVEVPAQPFDVATRYGALKIAPAAVQAITFAAEGSGVHQIQLTDGSRFAGLVSGEQFQFKLAGGAGGQSVTLPASSLARLQVDHKETDQPGDDAPTVTLANEDLLVGAITGELKLDTSFDTITLGAPQIRTLSRNKEAAGGTDVQIELWDQSRLSGQLQQQELNVALVSGLTIKVPLLSIEQYDQPLPQPSAAMVDRIKQLVTELSAEDWKQRERAEASLAQMGVGVLGTLKELRPTVGPEAQQRIDSVLRQLEASRSKAPTPPAVTPEGE